VDRDDPADVLMGSESPGCSGSAYLYLSGASGFTSQVFVGPAPSGSSVGYGSAASLVPGTKIVLVGDKWATAGGVSNAGQVYVYKVN
jgi:hypothetical protein